MSWANKVLFFFLVSIFFCSKSVAQVDELVKSLELKYPKENFITTLEYRKYKIEMINNKPKVYLETYTEMILMNDFLRGVDEGEVSYSKLRKLNEIEAWTMTPVKDEYKKVKVSKFETKKELDDAIFHDDIETKVFNFSDLKRGAKRCQKASYEFELHEIFDYAILMNQTPIVRYEIEVEVDNEIALRYKDYNLENIKFDFQKTTKKNATIYKWIFNDLKKYKSESASCGFLYFAPHIRFLVDYYIGKNKDTIKGLQTPQNLYEFNYQFIANLKECTQNEYKKTIDSLIKGEENDEQKAKKIFSWVQKNIKYIAFESGFQGYIPREADDIFSKKYGDCKDMANIIHKSFKYAKLDSVYLTWIGTDKLPYRIEDFPHPGAFNHMIAVWKHKGKNYILDATNSYTKWGLPSSFVQTKQGFLSINEKQYEILPIQPISNEENKKMIQVSAEIVGDTLKGKASCIMTGYIKDYFIMNTDYLKGNGRFQRLKNFLELGNNKFNLGSYKEYNLENLDSPLLITYDFIIPNYVSKIKNDIFLNPYLEKYETSDDLNESRISDIKADFHSNQSIQIDIKIPEGYSLKYKPKDEFIEYDEFFFNSSFSITESKISLNYEFINDFIILPKSKYKDLKNFQNKILEILSETISFEKK